MFGLGGTEIMVVGLILLLIFGPSQLPRLVKGLGDSVREMRKAARDDEPKPQEEKKP